jgi:hypothetical protein
MSVPLNLRSGTRTLYASFVTNRILLSQEDMATALVGALMAPLLLDRLHDRQLARLEPDQTELGFPSKQ